MLDPSFNYDANNRVVTPGYFEAMRIPLRRGRLFDKGDGQDAPLVAIINETLARRFWPNQPLPSRDACRMKSSRPGIQVMMDIRISSTESLPSTYSAREKGRAR